MTRLCAPPAAPKHPLRSNWGKLNLSSSALAIARSAAQSQSTTLIITPNVNQAQQLHDALEVFLDEDQRNSLGIFSDWETLPYDSFSPHQDIISDRLRCLYSLTNNHKPFVIVSAQTLLQRLVPVDYVNSRSLVLSKGQTLDRDKFFDQLSHSGYERVDTVFQHGEFAVRGSLIDIFPMGSEQSYRLELFDNEIETLRAFDPETQRTLKVVDTIELLPGRECPLDKKAISQFKDSWRKTFSSDHRNCLIYQDVAAGLPPAGIEYYLPLFFSSTATLFDYLPDNTNIFCLDGIEASFESFWRELTSRYQSRNSDISRPILKPSEIFLPINECFSQLKRFSRIDIHTKELESKAGYTNFATAALPLIAIESRATNPHHRIEQYLISCEKRVIFCAETEGRREVIKEQLAKINVRPTEFSHFNDFLVAADKAGIVVANLEEGINSLADNFVAITESMLFGEQVQQSRRRSTKKGDEPENVIKNLTELKVNAAVVHIEHGVGRYRGLQVIEHSGQADEFLVLEYAENSKLYVPVTGLHLISQYAGADEDHTPIHRLGGEVWQKAKRKAAEKIRDVAAELLHIYAKRKARKGYQHEVPADLYDRFSQEFAFEETPDQSAAIAAVRSDMLSEQPMDRLVCGDVGFGKTEVAMRAAFISVHNSKQVIILVPTTLLAQQHFDNFKDRFANWPVNVDVISRFRSTKESNEIKKQCANGKLDIIIGTHKLIGGDMEYSNLGLVIIDEEHRFGVRQKDALKALRTEVDILTLTATPIPRTLNMSMSGIRDLSIIATPPAKRLSVKTFVREHDDNLIKEAITREIMRGGQVYYLHNEVKSIEKTARDIEALVPDARVQIGHGQMRERELERVMGDFYHKRFNILVCTTIIETGIDVPTANTIIIDRADKFGLAQLHQLRGRVGRSHHQAYAYLLRPHVKTITKDATKRLDAIEEAQDLGAGFTLASHDMEIRGAGELLGDEQSGQIHTIGFTLYMDMLDKAVKAIKNGKELDLEAPFDHEVEINLRIPALIPEDYLPDVALRLNLYKRLASSADIKDLESLMVEMIDRFGLLPDPVKNLFRQTQLRFKATSLGLTKIEATAGSGKIEFAKETSVEPLTLVQLVQNQPQRYKLQGANQLQFSFDMESTEERLSTIETLLQTLAGSH
ncbi:MAG: transcription-repair coupling factor (superfamily II helicase) [Flavobacteriales bacterium]|jgi:transcription-repair coupling factor (superfamily II helicase)